MKISVSQSYSSSTTCCDCEKSKDDYNNSVYYWMRKTICCQQMQPDLLGIRHFYYLLNGCRTKANSDTSIEH